MWRPSPRPDNRALAEINQRLSRIQHNTEATMTALDNLQAADTALKAEVTQAITDWQAQLAAASDDPAIQAVADDMNATIAQLQGADPGTQPAGSGTDTPAPTDGTDTPPAA